MVQKGPGSHQLLQNQTHESIVGVKECRIIREKTLRILSMVRLFPIHSNQD